MTVFVFVHLLIIGNYLKFKFYKLIFFFIDYDGFANGVYLIKKFDQKNKIINNESKHKGKKIN